ncbi:hypothetical protein Lal_00042476 [Lupinus albus]|nr:hypothetical protein Lal_00042476 [Lupinus albus]
MLALRGISTCVLSTRWSSGGLTGLTPWDFSSSGGLRTYMLSALIRSEHSYAAFTAGAITAILELTYRFNGRTAQPLERTTAPGCDEPTSRCQTSPSMWTLGGDQPVILCQAPFYLYARWLISDQPEGTIGRLRYCLGGDRPSQTAQLKLSPTRITESGVSPYTSPYGLAETCVFVKQSLEPRRCDHLMLQTRSLTHYHGTSSSEVTRLFCRVP